MNERAVYKSRQLAQEGYGGIAGFTDNNLTGAGSINIETGLWIEGKVWL